MKSGYVYITKEFVIKNQKQIRNAIDFNTLSRFSPRRIIVEMARTEFRYSENTLPMDIWHSIIKIYNEIL